MSLSPSLSAASDEDILAELANRRHLVVQVWNVEDARGGIGEDDEFDALEPERQDIVAKSFLERSAGGLTDILGERGNSYLSDQWPLVKDDILAEITETPTP